MFLQLSQPAVALQREDLNNTVTILDLNAAFLGDLSEEDQRIPVL